MRRPLWSFGLLRSRAGRRRATRHGVSLLEALIAMFVLTVGVMSAAALIPLGRSEMVKGGIEDRKAILGQSAFNEWKTRGIGNPVNWTRSDGTAFMVTDASGFPQFDTSNPVVAPWCIDPLFSSTTNATFPVNTYVATPYAASTPTTLPARPLPRLGLRTFSPSAAPWPLTGPPADQAFVSHDDLLFNLPTSGDQPPTAQLNRSNSKRDFDPVYSWFATVMPASADNPNQCLLSIVVVNRRAPPLKNTNPGVLTANQAPVNQVADSERMVDVTFQAGSGWGGGDVILKETGAATPVELLCKPGDWIMLSGIEDPTATNKRQVIRWYRIAAIDQNLASTTLSLTTRSATLAGADWRYGATTNSATLPACTGTLVEGVVGVYERTIRLENKWMWAQ